MNNETMFYFFEKLTTKDITKFEDRFYHTMSLNGIPTTYYGLIFDKEDIDSGMFDEMISTFEPITIYCGDNTLYQMVQLKDYSCTFVPFWQGMGFMPILVVPAINGDIEMSRGLIKDVEVKEYGKF